MARKAKRYLETEYGTRIAIGSSTGSAASKAWSRPTIDKVIQEESKRYRPRFARHF